MLAWNWDEGALLFFVLPSWDLQFLDFRHCGAPSGVGFGPTGQKRSVSKRNSPENRPSATYQVP